MSYSIPSEALEPKATDILHLDVDTDPFKPEPAERKNYFHGFSDGQRLLARTGHDRWTKTTYTYTSG